MKNRPLLSVCAALALLPAAGRQAWANGTSSPTFRSAAPLPAEDKKHLLNDRFTVVKTVRAMPPAVQKMLIPDTREPLNGIADAGQPYEQGDAISGKHRPFRRLVLAAVNAQYCLVYFEQGGIAYRQHVTLFRLQKGQATVHWEADLFPARGLMTLPELRAALKASTAQASASSS